MCASTELRAADPSAPATGCRCCCCCCRRSLLRFTVSHRARRKAALRETGPCAPGRRPRRRISARSARSALTCCARAVARCRSRRRLAVAGSTPVVDAGSRAGAGVWRRLRSSMLATGGHSPPMALAPSVGGRSMCSAGEEGPGAARCIAACVAAAARLSSRSCTSRRLRDCPSPFTTATQAALPDLRTSHMRMPPSASPEESRYSLLGRER